ncbi:hypothetical protein HOF92_11380 [bacterium]|jgi:hypothetical protein|nr:hypothetical protein [bacterium]
MAKINDYSHVIRLFILLLIIGVTLLVLRNRYIPGTFGQYGTYRGASVEEIRASKKKFIGSQMCKMCHSDAWELWDSQAHKNVSCETCHGSAYKHVSMDSKVEPKLSIPKNADFLKGNSHKLCVSCHEKNPGRPESHPQVNVKEHLDRLGMDPDSEMYQNVFNCVQCHKGHKPAMF